VDGKFDGTDYPVQGVEVVVTNAYRRVDDRTWMRSSRKSDGGSSRVRHGAGMAVLARRQDASTTVTSVQNGQMTTVFDRM
jgi:hypothetical protein